jgi:hypothetical protein
MLNKSIYLILVTLLAASPVWSQGNSSKKSQKSSYQAAKKACLSEDSQMSKTELKSCIKQKRAKKSKTTKR